MVSPPSSSSSSKVALRSLAPLLLLLGPLASVARGAAWNRTDVFSGTDFFDDFNYFTDKDPTNGLITYQSLSSSQSRNLTYVDTATGDFVLRVDTTEVQLEGRPSVRITSKNSYEDGVFVMNFTHVPTGCATWPAFWMVNADLNQYPADGEIDIMEQANDQYGVNLVSVHTAGSCTIPRNISTQLGYVDSSTASGILTNCSAYTQANSGCRVVAGGSKVTQPTWGSSLNAQGGGIIAMERSMGSQGNGVRVWQWSHSAAPADLAASSRSVDPSNWGTPLTHHPFQNDAICRAGLGPLNFVLNIALCGDWAANTYSQVPTCAQTYGACSAQVGYNGSSFGNAYWQVSSIRAFTSGGGATNAANSQNTLNVSSSANSSSSGGSGSGSGSSSAAAPSSPASLGRTSAAAIGGAVSLALVALAVLF